MVCVSWNRWKGSDWKLIILIWTKSEKHCSPRIEVLDINFQEEYCTRLYVLIPFQPKHNVTLVELQLTPTRATDGRGKLLVVLRGFLDKTI